FVVPDDRHRKGDQIGFPGTVSSRRKKSGGSWLCAPVEKLAQLRRADVPAAADKGQLPAGEARLQLGGRRQRRSTCRFDQIARDLEQAQGRRSQLVVADEHEVVEMLGEDSLR